MWPGRIVKIKTMKKIIELKQKFTPAADKLAHFFWGDIYSSIGMFIALFINMYYSSLFLALIPFLFAAIPAYLKEYWDGKGNGFKENADFVYTIVSSIPKAIIILIHMFSKQL